MRLTSKNCEACATLQKPRCFCGHLSAEELHEIHANSLKITLKRGETLDAEALDDCPLVIVAEGVISMQYVLDDGRRTISAFFVEGDLVDQRNASSRMHGNLVALTKAAVCRMSLVAFETAVANNAEARGVAWENLREQASRAIHHSADLGKKQALEKLASFIFECHHRQGGGASAQSVEIPIRRCDLAEYLGLQPETVSRGFRELEARGILAFRSLSDIEIRNLPDLKRIANGGESRGELARRNGVGVRSAVVS